MKDVSHHYLTPDKSNVAQDGLELTDYCFFSIGKGECQHCLSLDLTSGYLHTLILRQALLSWKKQKITTVDKSIHLYSLSAMICPIQCLGTTEKRVEFS